MKKAKTKTTGKAPSRGTLVLALGLSPPRRMTPFEHAMHTRNCTVVQAFLEETPQEDDELWAAVNFLENKRGLDDLILILLEKIRDPSKFDASAYLCQFAYHGLTRCATKVLNDFPIENINHLHHPWGSPLTVAVRMSSTEIALMLLDMTGVDINLKNANGRGPIWFAACNRNEVVLRKLLDMGAESMEADAEDSLPEERTTEKLAAVIRDSQDHAIGELDPFAE